MLDHTYGLDRMFINYCDGSKKSSYQSNILKHVCVFPQCQVCGVEPSQVPTQVNTQHREEIYSTE